LDGFFSFGGLALGWLIGWDENGLGVYGMFSFPFGFLLNNTMLADD